MFSHAAVGHLPLINLGESVPVGIVEFDTIILHPCFNELVFATANVAWALEKAHELDDEIVADDRGKFLTGRTREKIVIFDLLEILELRDCDGDIRLRQSRLSDVTRTRHKIGFEQTMLSAVPLQRNRLLPSVLVNEPLSEVRRQLNMKNFITHKRLIFHIQSYRKSASYRRNCSLALPIIGNETELKKVQ